MINRNEKLEELADSYEEELGHKVHQLMADVIDVLSECDTLNYMQKIAKVFFDNDSVEMGERCLITEEISDYSEIDIKSCKKLIKKMKEMGYVESITRFDLENSKMMGRGYQLTDKGFLNFLEDELY